MILRSEAEKHIRNSEDLCAFVEKLGYDTEPKQLQCRNGAPSPHFSTSSTTSPARSRHFRIGCWRTTMSRKMRRSAKRWTKMSWRRNVRLRSPSTTARAMSHLDESKLGSMSV